MGFIAAGTQFGLKGGNSALERRQEKFQEMQALARQESLLPEDQEAPEPTGFKGFFFRAVDLISRPNYAMAGFADTLAGNGREGEWAAQRVVRELFSGAFGLEGDKETFGDVLEQAGMEEGGKLSDLIGENGLTKRFNPSTRGAVGLAMDIFFDPLTYISAPVKNAATLVGVGGEIRYLNKAGVDALGQRYTQQLDLWRKQMNMSADASEVAVLGRVREAAIKGTENAEVARGLVSSLDDLGEGALRTESMGVVELRAGLRRQAGREILEEGREELFEKTGLRFRLGALDAPVGIDKALGKAWEGGGQLLRGTISRSEQGRRLLEMGDQAFDDLTKLFNRHPRLARMNKAYVRMEAERFQKFQSASHIAGMEADALLSGISKDQLNNHELWEQFARATEDADGEAIAKFVEMATEEGIDNPQRLIERWHALFERVGALEVRQELLDADRFYAWSGAYFPRLLGKLPKDVRNKLKKYTTGVSASTGSFSEARKFRSWDEFKQAALEAGARESDLIVNPREVAAARLSAHYEAIVNQDFIERLRKTMGVQESKQLRRLRSHLATKGLKVDDELARTFEELLERDEVAVGSGAANASRTAYMRRLIAESPETEAIEKIQEVVEQLRTANNKLEVNKAQAEAARSVSKLFDFNRRLDVSESAKTSRYILSEAKRLRELKRDAQTMRKLTVQKAREYVNQPEAFPDLNYNFDVQSRRLREMDEAYSNLDEALTYKEGAATRKLFRPQMQRQRELVRDLRKMLRDFRKSTVKGVDEEMRAHLQGYADGIDELMRGHRALIEERKGLRLAREKARADFEKFDDMVREIEEQMTYNRVSVKQGRRAIAEARAFRKEQLPSSRAEVRKADLRQFRRLSTEQQKAYLSSVLERLETTEQVEGFLKKYGDDLRRLDLNETVDSMYKGERLNLRDINGQEYVRTTIGEKTYSLPKGIAEDLENFDEEFLQNPEVGRLLSTFDLLNNFFKVSVTRLFPAFHIRNAYSNVASVFTDIGIDAANPIRSKQAFDIMRGGDGTLLLKDGSSITYEALRGEMDVLGVRVDKLLLAELTGNVKGDPIEWIIQKRLKAGAADQKFWGLAEHAYSLPNQIENHARAMHYISLRRKGFSPEDASFQVNKFLFDYSDLSAVEKGFFRRIFPFWTWTRKNAERQIRNLYERPGRLATQTKIAMEDRGPDGDHLPEYLRGQMSVKLEEGPDGETWLTGIDLPFSSTDIMWAGSLGKTFREQIGMVTPIIKTPLEAGIGMDFFSGRSIRGVGTIRDALGKSMARNMPQPMQDWFELKNVGTEEEPRFVANRLKIHLVMKGAFISRMVSQQTQFDKFLEEIGNGEEAAGARAAMKILAGLDLRSYDLTEKQQRTLYNRSKRIEDVLVNRGFMREFTRRYIPKEEQQDSPGGIPNALVFGGRDVSVGTGGRR